MGTPLPPNLPANDCLACWGAGKPFGVLPSPHVIEARLTRLLPGAFWVDTDELLLLTTHYLEQTAAPCIYRIDDHTFTWILQWFPGFTEFSVLRNGDGRSVFFHDLDQPCESDLDNQILNPAGVVAWNGFANFTWNPEDLD